jgi:class 3 adenylate cyclase
MSSLLTTEDVAWTRVTDESFHPVIGFNDAALEPHYLVHLHKSIGSIITVVILFVVFLPLALILGITTVPIDSGYGYWSVILASGFAAVFAVVLVLTRYHVPDPVRRAKLHDVLVALIGAAVILPMWHSQFESNNMCAKERFRKDPSADPQVVRTACVTSIYTYVFVLFAVSIAFYVRTMVLYPLFVALLAVTFLPLLYLTDGESINTAPQIIVRGVIYVALLLTVVVAVHVINTANRNAFLLHKNVVRLTQVTKETAKQINGLLEAMLPESVLARVAAGEDRIFDVAKVASVSFSDVAGFTNWSSTRTSHDVVQMVSTLVSAYDVAAKECQVAKVKTIGDAYWAISGLPEPTDESAVRICNFGLRQQELLVELNDKNPQWNGIELRVGCHTGQLVGGVIGTRQLAYEVFGETNHIAEQHEQAAPLGGVLVSSATMEHAKTHSSAYAFTAHDVMIHDCSTFTATRRAIGADAAHRRTVRPRPSPAGDADGTLAGADDRNNVMRFLGLKKKKHASRSASTVTSARGNHTARSYQVSPRKEQLADEPQMEMETPAIVATDAFEIDQSDDDDTEEMTPDIDTTTSCGFTRFTSPAIEEEFVDADVAAKRILRQVTSGSIGVTGLTFTLAILIEVPPAQYGDAAGALLMLLVTAALMMGLCAVARFVEFTRFHSKVFYFVSWGVAVVGYLAAIELAPKQLMISDPWTIYCIVVTSFYISPPADVSNFVHIAISFASCIATAVVARFANSLAYNIFVVVCVAIFSSVWFGVVQDYRDRTRFATVKLADSAATVARSEETLQRQILASMAPAHVQDDMVALVTSAGFRAGEAVSISHALPNVTVCFCKIKTKEDVDDAHEAYEDILDNHRRVEACLEKYPLAIKIKSVGSMIVVAGPLHVSATEAEARAAAKDVFNFAQDITHRFRGLDGTRGLAKRAGVSSGPVVASVMGTDRLAYDIFGDTVNIASRCMSTAQEFTMQSPMVTQALYRDEGATMPAGDVVQVFMKGKGDVDVLRC